MEKEVSLLGFRQILINVLPAAFIQLYNYDLLQKSWLKLSPLIQNSVEQDYIPDSCARYHLSYQKGQNVVALTRCGLSPLPWTLIENTGDGGKSYPTTKNLLISPIRKTPLNRIKSFAIKKFFSSPSNGNFQATTLRKLHL